MLFNRQFISSVVPEAKFLGTEMQDFNGASLDSRQLNKGELFVAIKGNRVDGHDFVNEAVAKGAAGLLISLEKESILKSIDAATLKKLFVILVPNTRDALIQLASAWRAQFSIPVIGITGSIGKTSTKEMLANIVTLNGMNCLASVGNQNTALGLSISILKMNEKHQVAILRWASVSVEKWHVWLRLYSLPQQL